MYTLPPEMANVPPNWMVYFAVEDCDATVAKASALGAQTISPAMDIPTVGRLRFCSIRRAPRSRDQVGNAAA